MYTVSEINEDLLLRRANIFQGELRVIKLMVCMGISFSNGADNVQVNTPCGHL